MLWWIFGRRGCSGVLAYFVVVIVVGGLIGLAAQALGLV